MGIREWLAEKLNPSQAHIVRDYGDSYTSSNYVTTHINAYNNIEIVRRGVDLIVDSSASIKFDIGPKLNINSSRAVRPKVLNTLINFLPNPFLGSDVFKRNIYMDLILEGNAFIYDDGVHLYNLPASKVEIVADTKQFIKEFVYSSEVKFDPSEIIFIRDNSSTSIFRGSSRLDSTRDTRKVLENMIKYQGNIFENDAVPGLILKTPNVLSKKVKEKIEQEWRIKYNPKVGGRRPLILDGEFDVSNLTNTSFKELDFINSSNLNELKILKALGVPPVLLESGNNANITPNLKLFYLTTVLPLVEKVTSSLETHFGYDIKLNKEEVLALKPELRDEAAYYTGLVNSGIMTRNEAREKMRLPPAAEEFADQLILPQNIAGSAVDSSDGGRPDQKE